jgi:hypothetical protein
MMPVIRIPDSVFERLQKHATPFVDTPATVIVKLLDAFERSAKHVERKSVQQTDSDGSIPDPGSRSSSDYWFVNVGEFDSRSRNWDDCRKYGFLAAGYGRYYSDQLGKLKVGDKVFAYMKGFGYVGFGEIFREACPVAEFIPFGSQEALLNHSLLAEEMNHSQEDPDLCEWIVAVKWQKAFSREEAKTFPGIFANQHIVCKLRNQKTLDFLLREFEVQVPKN